MLNPGDKVTLTIDSAAHGGEGVARFEGMAVFVQGAIPGDTVEARIVEAKKRFGRAVVDEVVAPSPHRVSHRCPAAEAGAGCCDYSAVDPAFEPQLKATVVKEQLERIGKLRHVPPIDVVDLAPTSGWRTRFRFGVDEQGRAGLRALHSNELITGRHCAQADPAILDDILAATDFTPGAELVVAIGSDGNRTVVESRKAARGRSVSRTLRHMSGPQRVTQKVGDTTFEVDPLAFWQAHVAAPDAYCDTVAEWLSDAEIPADGVVWDLYGGVGLFATAVRRALPKAEVWSVELGKRAAEVGAQALGDSKVHFVTADVARVVEKLPAPDVVVLDPPRKGAGADVVAQIASDVPSAVIHVGCDPATLARDLAAWQQHGYQARTLRMFNAFPGTHHSETFCFLTRD